MRTDEELLRCYVSQQDEDAFRELVHRHVNLVYGVALRRLGGDAHAAADVTQKVFTALARKAAALTGRTLLPSWLYGAARNLSADFVRSEHARRAREKEAHAMHELVANAFAHADWERLRPLLDDTLDELTTRDREAVILRFFARQSFAEIGAALQLSESAARMRVERALDKLHRLLAKRGVNSTASALGLLLANQAAANAPAGLAAAVSGVALSGVAVVSGSPLAGWIVIMSATKTSIVLGVTGALALGVALYQARAADATRREISSARSAEAVLAARSHTLETSLALAERQRTEQQAALAAAKSALATAAAPAPAAEPRSNPVADMLRQVIARDPELQKQAEEGQRARFRAANAPFLRSIGFTTAQIEQAADLYLKSSALEIGWGPSRPATSSSEDYLRDFRNAFGDVAAGQYRQFNEDRRAMPILSHLSGRLAYADAPLAPPQIGKLAGVINAASTPGIGGLLRDTVVDWDAVFAQATSFLSPVQLQGLQAVAAFDRNQMMLATALAAAPASNP